MEMTNKDEIVFALESKLGSCIKKDPEYIFSCPNKDCESHKKNKLKLQVNLKKNAFHCWVCELKGSNIYFLFKKLGLDTSIISIKPIQDEIDLFEDEQKEYIHIEKIPNNFKLIYTNKANSNNYIQAVRYLKKRKISKFDIIKYQIHYNLEDYSILIPSFDKRGNVNTYFIRNIFDDKKIMPIYPKKEVIPNELFIDWEEPIILVEGFFDAFTAGDNAIPLLGSSIRADFRLFREMIIHRPPLVYLALDRDAFVKKTLRIAKLLNKYEFKVKIINFPTDDDINKIGKASFEALKEKSELYHELYETEYLLSQI